LIAETRKEQSEDATERVETAAAAMMSSLDKLSESSENSTSNHNGETNHQDSNDSAVHSDYDDSASDENAKTNSKSLSKDAEKTVTPVDKPAVNGTAVTPKTEKEQELIVIQDNLFNVKVNAPGVDLFDVQVSFLHYFH